MTAPEPALEIKFDQKSPQSQQKCLPNIHVPQLNMITKANANNLFHTFFTSNTPVD